MSDNGSSLASNTDGHSTRTTDNDEADKEIWHLTGFGGWDSDTDSPPFTSYKPPANDTLSSLSLDGDDAVTQGLAGSDNSIAAARGPLSPSPISTSSHRESTHLDPNTGYLSEWYFAIGSMVNPTSLRLRKLTPLESYCGILRDWKLVFLGDCGMASILPCSSTAPATRAGPFHRGDFHGVLHRLPKEQMNKLDVIESSYDRLEVEIECYDGVTQRAVVYKMAEQKLDPSKPDALPSERYLDIISQGLVHHGVHAEYIRWVRGHSCVKRKLPSAYKKIPIHALHQSGAKKLQMTAEELQRFDGSAIEEIDEQEEVEVMKNVTVNAVVNHVQADEELLLPISSISRTPSPRSRSKHSPSSDCCENSSVDPVDADANCCIASPVSVCLNSPSPSSCSPSIPPTCSPPLTVGPWVLDSTRFYPLRIAVNKKILEWVGDLSQPLLANTYEFMRFNFGGTDLTVSYTAIFFEPKYPIPKSYEEMSHEHRAMIEDIFAEKVMSEDPSKREWKLVGFLSSSEQKSSQQAGREKLVRNKMNSMAAGLDRLVTESEEVDDGTGSARGGASRNGRNSTPAVHRAPSTGNVPAAGGLWDPDDDTSNMFLSLSMEDHSGASSTCFAYCCAGAQPFHAQRVRDAQLATQRHKMLAEVGKAGPRTHKPRDTHHHSRGAPSNASATSSAAKKAAPAPRGKERKRRHSIGNVGLHQMQQNQNNQQQVASESAAMIAAAGQIQPGDAQREFHATSSDGGVARATGTSTTASHHSSSTTALPRAPRPNRVRASSICTGILSSLHSPISTTGPGSVTTCLSPKRARGNSLDDLNVNSPAVAAATAARLQAVSPPRPTVESFGTLSKHQ